MCKLPVVSVKLNQILVLMYNRSSYFYSQNHFFSSIDMCFRIGRAVASFVIVKKKPCFCALRRASSASDANQICSKMLVKVREASKEFKTQSIDISDMCSAARIRRQELENQLDEVRKFHLESDTRMLQSLVTTLKSYCIRLSALQGETESVCKELEKFLSTNAKMLNPHPSREETSKPKAPTVTSISETEIELEETTQTKSACLTTNEITEYLHEKSVDFSDCFDQTSLEKRYLDVKSGVYQPPKKSNSKPTESSGITNQQSFSSIREPVSYKRKSNNENTSSGQNMNYGGSSQQGIMQDPYPGAERRMCDPMKYVWEVKQDICQGKGVNSSQVDIWCGPMKLEDHRRMYEYPQCQRSPMEVRMKGDTRINKNLC